MVSLGENVWMGDQGVFSRDWVGSACGEFNYFRVTARPDCNGIGLESVRRVK